jgi:hypothetical protein
MRVVLRLLCACAVAYVILFLSAWYADRNPRFAAAIGGHDIVLQLLLTVPVLYLLLGLLPVFQRRSSKRD